MMPAKSMSLNLIIITFSGVYNFVEKNVDVLIVYLTQKCQILSYVVLFNGCDFALFYHL